MRKLFFYVVYCLLLTRSAGLWAQDIRFKKVLNGIDVYDMVQDKQGYIWFGTYEQGLKRFDGVNVKTYAKDTRNTGSISGNSIVSIYVDTDNSLWLSMLASGLDRFDPATNTFTHYRHDPKDPGSLANDTVFSARKDRLGNLWVGTRQGLDMLDTKTGKFIHYKNDPADPASISNNSASYIYEDSNGELWIGCWDYLIQSNSGDGGLNRFDRKTKKFTRYLHDPSDPKSIHNNKIYSIYEDSHKNFWVIAADEGGLSLLDRKTGTFIRYYADPVKLSFGTTPVSEKLFPFTNSISEDITGALWIATGTSGINKYDPVKKTVVHYGPVYLDNKLISGKDTASGFNARIIYKTLTSKDGLFWLATNSREIYNTDYRKTTVPFFTINQQEANAFYCEENKNILWIGTKDGLLCRDLLTNTDKIWKHDPKNDNSLAFDKISSIKVDKEGYLWLGTRGGLDRFDTRTGSFLHYKADPKDSTSLYNGNIKYMHFDPGENLWMASDSGIFRLDKITRKFTNYTKSKMDAAGASFFSLFCITGDRDGNIWVASDNGTLRFDIKEGSFKRYISGNTIKTICVDSKGTIWAGGETGLYSYDKMKDEFILFADESSAISVNGVFNILEDDRKELWISTGFSLVRISEDRKRVKKYTEANGIRYSNFDYNDNFKSKDGRLFFGELNGYYAFYPDDLKDPVSTQLLSINRFKLKDRQIIPGPDEVLKVPVTETGEIRLKYNQNVFSFDFISIDYVSPGDEKYVFMLENYDDTWHDIGSDRRASFFNIPPGNYNFRVKAVGADGTENEKSIRIIISPPWWKTWWAYSLYGLLIILGGYLIYRYQKAYIVRRERETTRQKELAQAREIEKAYNELKTTQQQLIQSEKMASLGELTAGIAHEIQNPLNFVNNFSEVNNELIEELKAEWPKVNGEKNAVVGEEILNDIQQNTQKIIFHGKRADAIVKGMLQHSRQSSGTKEPTDINALCDEYLRLAYHGLRAKDKSFNAEFKTDFDDKIGKVNIVPQDIGRVLLNLINNAFYAVNEKNTQLANSYQPIAKVTTRRLNDVIEIRVEDNGNGIPQSVVDKIFQPFFTTKPTGQGTGLGLSLSYDIVKAHGGELKVETKEGEGALFIIQIPA